MNENFINMYIDTLNKRLEEFIKNETLLNSKVRLYEENIKSYDESIKQYTKENENKINDSVLALSEKEQIIQTLVNEKNVLIEASEKISNDYSSNVKHIENLQQNISIITNQNEAFKNNIISLEKEVNTSYSKIEEKNKEIDILKESHKKEKEYLENQISFLKEETQKVQESVKRKHIKHL